MKLASSLLTAVLAACVSVVLVAAETPTRTAPKTTTTPTLSSTPAKPVINTPACGYELGQTTPPGVIAKSAPGTPVKDAVTIKTANMIGAIGDSVPLKAQLFHQKTGQPVHSHTLRFKVNGILIGQDKTDGQGMAKVTYKVPNDMGPKTIEASYAGSDQCQPGKDTANFGTVKSATKVVLNPPSQAPKAGGKLTVSGKVTRITDNLGLDGRLLTLRLNGKEVGKETSVNGNLSISVDIPANFGANGTLNAQFEGDALYAATSDNLNFSIKPPMQTAYLKWTGAEGKLGDTVTFTAHFTKNANGSGGIAGKKVRFWIDRGPRWAAPHIDAIALGSDTTDASGKAVLSYKIDLKPHQMANHELPLGYTMYAHVDGVQDEYKQEKVSDPTLKVNKANTKVTISGPTSGKIGQVLKMKVKLTRASDNAPIADQTLQGSTGTKKTDASGEIPFDLSLASGMGVGPYMLKSKFLGGKFHLPAEDSHTIQVSPSTN